MPPRGRRRSLGDSVPVSWPRYSPVEENSSMTLAPAFDDEEVAGGGVDGDAGKFG